MLPKLTKKEEGFTLIELLVVIAIIAILATIVFVALDPAKRFADARNSRRWNDVNTILTAVHSCIVDNGGIYTECGLEAPPTVTGPAEISSLPLMDDPDTTTADDGPLAPYLKSLPTDPQEDTGTGYELEVDENGLVTVTATLTEDQTTDISVSR